VITPSVDAQVDGFFTRPTDEGISLAVVVLQRGAVVAEQYGTKPANAFEPEQAVDADTTLISRSMAKSITHAVIGLLVADGRLDVGSPAPVPEWTPAGRLAPHAASAASGMASANAAMSGTPANNASRPTLRTPDTEPPRSSLTCMIASCNRSNARFRSIEPKG